MCSVDGCDKPHIARGWCHMHYKRWRRKGDSDNMEIKILYKTSEEAFENRTQWQPNGCLLWLGHVNNQGYGAIKVNGKNAGTHCYAWEQANGPIPDGLFVLHHCDRPPCCNVDHLFLGTQQDNMDDMIAKGRDNKAKGEKHHSAKLAETDIKCIRADNRPQTIIGEDYEVSLQTISDIKRYKTWKHI